MNKQFIASLCLLTMVGVAVGVGVKAVNTVTCTVTPGLVSVEVGPTSVAYGTMPFNDTESSGTITATVGSVPTALGIIGYDATQSTTDDVNWILDATIGTENHYVHAYTTNMEVGSGTTLGTETEYSTKWVALGKVDYATLASNIEAGENQTFQLDMRTPSSSSASVYGEHTTDVTIQATWAE